MTSEVEIPLPLDELQRLGRFLVVGLTSTMLDFGVLLLLKMAGAPTGLAGGLAFMVGLVNNFVWNRQWTFADAPAQPLAAQFARFGLVAGVGLGLNLGLLLGLEAPLAAWLGVPADQGYVPAKALATVVVVGWNFAANRWWTFRALAGGRVD